MVNVWLRIPEQVRFWELDYRGLAGFDLGERSSKDFPQVDCWIEAEYKFNSPFQTSVIRWFFFHSPCRFGLCILWYWVVLNFWDLLRWLERSILLLTVLLSPEFNSKNSLCSAIVLQSRQNGANSSMVFARSDWLVLLNTFFWLAENFGLKCILARKFAHFSP